MAGAQPAPIDRRAHTRAQPRTAHPWSSPSTAPPEACHRRRRRESRKRPHPGRTRKTARWWRGEVLGRLAHDARVILVGNWLHLDVLMARMKATGRYKVLEFSLLREGDGTEIERCVWPALYPTQEHIDK